MRNGTTHNGMTCEEFKDVSSDGAIAFKKWGKENDARTCPKCKVVIEKSHGCNHMTCFRSKAHIRWFCMKCFQTSKKFYDHVSEVHRGFYH